MVSEFTNVINYLQVQKRQQCKFMIQCSYKTFKKTKRKNDSTQVPPLEKKPPIYVGFKR